MKNSTLLRLFFISIGLPLACASTLKPKQGTLILVDTVNTVPAVPLESADPIVIIFSKRFPFYQRVQCSPEKFKELIQKRDYEAIRKIGGKMNPDKFQKYLCQVVTSLDQFKDFFEYLKQHKMVTYFLAHGETEAVMKVIAEKNLLKPNDSGHYDNIHDAIIMSLSEDNHERAMNLFQGAREMWTLKSIFVEFVSHFFKSHPLRKNSMSIKRFLTLQGEEFSKKHPDTFETICKELVGHLKDELANPDSQKLLADLVRQPFIITPTAVTKVFVGADRVIDYANFIEYGWREAFANVLNDNYSDKLWVRMGKVCKTQFSIAHIYSKETIQTAIKDFPTKQEREELWQTSHPPNEKTEERAKQLVESLDKSSIALPTVIWGIVVDYIIFPSWIDYD